MGVAKDQDLKTPGFVFPQQSLEWSHKPPPGKIPTWIGAGVEE